MFKEFETSMSKQEHFLVDSLYNNKGYFKFYVQTDSVFLNSRKVYTLGFSKYVGGISIKELKDNFSVESKELANLVYREVIPDSLIYKDFEIRFSCTMIDTVLLKSSIHGFKTDNIFQIDSLEKWNGFKVIRNEKGSYERVLLE